MTPAGFRPTKQDRRELAGQIATDSYPSLEAVFARGLAWVGYKNHLSENCDDPETSQRPALIDRVVTSATRLHRCG